MEGFRFWKQGYWRNHLQGRRYHISALYVVDLKRFRKVAAGDRLRGQYQVINIIHFRVVPYTAELSPTEITPAFILFICVGSQSRPEQFVQFGSRSAEQYDPSSSRKIAATGVALVPDVVQ